MITIDKPIPPKTLNRINSKTYDKKGAGKTSFNDTAILEGSNTEHVSEIPDINPFLFLQEISEYKDDQQKLKEAGDKILECLNDIRIGLIDGEFSIQNITNLKEILEQNRSKFKFLELQDVIDDIILRSEVELAKIEMRSKKI